MKILQLIQFDIIQRSSCQEQHRRTVAIPATTNRTSSLIFAHTNTNTNTSTSISTPSPVSQLPTTTTTKMRTKKKKKTRSLPLLLFTGDNDDFLPQNRPILLSLFLLKVMLLLLPEKVVAAVQITSGNIAFAYVVTLMISGRGNNQKLKKKMLNNSNQKALLSSVSTSTAATGRMKERKTLLWQKE